MKPFIEWELRAELQEALAKQGFETPTQVQDEAYPMVMAGDDLLAQSRTGTGKTLAFGLPIVQRLQAGRGKVAVLVVLPTRELAMQVGADLNRLAAPLGISVATIYGGGSYRDQFQALERGAQIVCGTPGRLVDHLDRGSLKLGECTTLVLDEADEILDMGFAEELDKVLAALPTERQSLLFSATMSPEARQLAKKALRNPKTLAVSTGLTSAPEIKHVSYEVFFEHRHDALINVLQTENPELALVFCHTKAETEDLVKRLHLEGITAAYLNGDLPQPARTQTLNSFRRRQVRLLVATDVAARGIDVKGISHVFNMGVTRDPETYIHRTGRTGRAGSTGTAVTFVPPRDAARFRQTLARAGVVLEMRPLPQAEEVRTKLRERCHADIVGRVTAPGGESFQALAQELLAYIEPADLVTALLQQDATAKAALEAGVDVPVPKARPAAWGPATVRTRGARPDHFERPDRFERKERPDRPDRPRKPRERGFEAGMVRVSINQGRIQRMGPSRIVAMVCGAAGIKGDAIGAITINPNSSFFDVRESDAARVVAKLDGMMADGQRLKASLTA